MREKEFEVFNAYVNEEIVKEIFVQENKIASEENLEKYFAYLEACNTYIEHRLSDLLNAEFEDILCELAHEYYDYRPEEDFEEAK